MSHGSGGTVCGYLQLCARDSGLQFVVIKTMTKLAFLLHPYMYTCVLRISLSKYSSLKRCLFKVFASITFYRTMAYSKTFSVFIMPKLLWTSIMNYLFWTLLLEPPVKSTQWILSYFEHECIWLFYTIQNGALPILNIPTKNGVSVKKNTMMFDLF